tara:strand:+ start:682 stop:861 length:180 start_codon:yes stop_codon:yes gene_type:complete
MRTDREFVSQKQNHGNQPWFQSSIKKRTVIETVVAFYMFGFNHHPRALLELTERNGVIY